MKSLLPGYGDSRDDSPGTQLGGTGISPHPSRGETNRRKQLALSAIRGISGGSLAGRWGLFNTCQLAPGSLMLVGGVLNDDFARPIGAPCQQRRPRSCL